MYLHIEPLDKYVFGVTAAVCILLGQFHNAICTDDAIACPNHGSHKINISYSDFYAGSSKQTLCTRGRDRDRGDSELDLELQCVSTECESGYWVFIPLPLSVCATQLQQAKPIKQIFELCFSVQLWPESSSPRLLSLSSLFPLLVLNLNIKLNKMCTACCGTKQMQKCYNLMDRRVEKVKNKRPGGGEGWER